MSIPSADLEFGLVWDVAQNSFDVSLRFTNTDNVDRVVHPRASLEIDVEALEQLVNDEPRYGAALTDMVFRSEDIRAFYTNAIAAANVVPTHFRFHIDGPARFHGLRWESLRDPTQQGRPIATSRNLLFSRYLSSPDWRPIPTVPRREPQALIVIANPSDLDQYAPGGRGLAPVQVEVELSRAQKALASYRPVVLARSGQPSLANLVSRLNDGFDVLYVVAHGALTDDVPLLFLEKADGTADPVDARRLVERIHDLEQRPSVVFLSSCESAGAGGEPCSADEGALAALGPRLASAGVAAVIAMQGNVTMRTASDFAPAFFEAFLEDGVVDRAMAVARDSVRDRPDWWVPVLFSRLRSGRTYYEAQFLEHAAETWDDLALMIKTGKFTPVVGQGLADGLLGSRQEIARRWVRRWQMPIARHGQGDLAQVAQYLRVGRSPARVSAYLQDYLRTELSERGENAQGDDPFRDLPGGLLEAGRPEDVIVEVGRRQRERDPGDPYRVVAALPVKVLVTTGWTDLLQEALRARGKQPTTACFQWTDRVDWDDDPLSAPPTTDQPLVYHLYGRLENPDSLVLTEDDYFEWLTAWIDKKLVIPGVVRSALTRNSLMFLGYRLDEWDFRVVFQSIKSFEGGLRNRFHNHIGVQLKPENQLIEPEAAQKYFESYFDEDRVSIFWANTRTFLDELRLRTGLKP